MRFRTLGRTGWKVSEVGFGAWGIGGGLWQDSDDRESIRALDRAVACGINFFDTALAYGQGHSERLLGDFLQRQNDRIYVATKIPPLNRVWPAQPGSTASTVFPSHHIIESTERSLKNLRVDTLDLQQFHVWRDEWINETEWWETVQLLKEQGKIRHFGVSVNDHEPETALAVVRMGKVDTVQVIYNIFDQSPAEALFPLCLEHNVGVIVRVPLDEGALTGRITPDTTFPEKDFRNKYFRGERKAAPWGRSAKSSGTCLALLSLSLSRQHGHRRNADGSSCRAKYPRCRRAYPQYTDAGAAQASLMEEEFLSLIVHSVSLILPCFFSIICRNDLREPFAAGS